MCIHYTASNCQSLLRQSDKFEIHSKINQLFYTSLVILAYWIVVSELKCKQQSQNIFLRYYHASKRKKCVNKVGNWPQLGGELYHVLKSLRVNFHGHLEAEWPQIQTRRSKLIIVPVLRAETEDF